MLFGNTRALHGFTLVSEDGDFYQRNLLVGRAAKVGLAPPWNCTCQQLLDLLIKHQKDVQALESATETVLLLS